jgi:hypothetical protein
MHVTISAGVEKAAAGAAVIVRRDVFIIGQPHQVPNLQARMQVGLVTTTLPGYTCLTC